MKRGREREREERGRKRGRKEERSMKEQEIVINNIRNTNKREFYTEYLKETESKDTKTNSSASPNDRYDVPTDW